MRRKANVVDYTFAESVFQCQKFLNKIECEHLVHTGDY